MDYWYYCMHDNIIQIMHLCGFQRLEQKFITSKQYVQIKDIACNIAVFT